MAAITRTSPLDLGEVRKTQRRLAALLNFPDQLNTSFNRRGRHLPRGFCYVCSHLDPRGRKGLGGGGRGGPKNPYRHLFPRPCAHLSPAAPQATFVGDGGDEEEEETEEEDDDDGFDEGSWDLEGNEDGGMFDTAILRDDGERDPRMFSLPPVFDKQGEQPLKDKRRSKNGRLVPVVSEKTFLSTNTRDPAPSGDPDPPSDLHLPKLSNQKGRSLVSEGKVPKVGQGQSNLNRKQKDPRRLHSERIDRRVVGDVLGEIITRSDSALGPGLTQTSTDLSREKTDPPPQPITVSIRNQDGEELPRTTHRENLPPGTQAPREAFGDQSGGKHSRRKKREKKRRPSSRDGSASSPTFSGSITISRETTLSGLDSPDYFLSRLRSASWCECPDHVPRASESRCGECRRVKDHEKWCVSRNSLCQNCGKPFKRRYPSQLERKSSFSALAVGSSGSGTSMMMINSLPPKSGSPSKTGRPQNCSPTKASFGDRLSSSGAVPASVKDMNNNNRRARIEEIVFPQRDADVSPDAELAGERGEGRPQQDQGKPVLEDNQRKSYLPSINANIHQRAYNLALADAKLKALSQKKKKPKALGHPNGVYFSYFPLLKRRKQIATSSTEGEELTVSPTLPQQTIGLRADVREGKQLKVKKGLKHILGDIKLDDYYPGGKRFPKDGS